MSEPEDLERLLGALAAERDPAKRGDLARELLVGAAALREGGRHEAAIGVAEGVLEEVGGVRLPSEPFVGFDALMIKAANLFDLGRTDEGLAVYDELVEAWGADRALHVRVKLADALAFKGHLVFRGPDGGERAIAVFDELVERFGGAGELELREKVASALAWKAMALQRIGRRAEADDVYDELVAGFGDAVEPALSSQVAFALEHKASNLIRLNRNDEALETCDELLVRFGEAAPADLREVGARVLKTKAHLLGLSGRHDEAIVVSAALLARLDGEESPRLRVLLAEMLLSSAAELVADERWEEALEVFDGVVARFEDAVDPALRERVALALSNSAVALVALGRDDDAAATHKDMVERFGDEGIASFEDLARKHGDSEDPSLRRRAVGALLNRAGILHELDRRDEALAALSGLIERYEDDGDEGVRELVDQARVQQGLLEDREDG
ncbi:MAG: hypothetical protein QOH12_3070 [Solirubrobacteraceae bacterium]|jgi:tetratricopeptide (TPR) repeat protein|nr:hypothetical protein [Solirubrobacteraceae bacterium]